jgi:hypothetical protein
MSFLFTETYVTLLINWWEKCTKHSNLVDSSELHFQNVFLYVIIGILSLTPWSTAHIDKLIVPKLIKKFPAFNKTRKLKLPHSREPATFSFPEPD